VDHEAIVVAQAVRALRDEVRVVLLDRSIDPDVVVEFEDHSRGGCVVVRRQFPVTVELPKRDDRRFVERKSSM
jgi:hypothetical protein